MNIGLVYSGGISKCAYQLGFTRALLEHIPRESIKAASGSSMGIFTAYATAADKLVELQDMYETINISSPARLFWNVCNKGLLSRAMNSFFALGDELLFPVCFPLTHIPILSTKYFWINGAYNPFWKKYIRAAANFPFLCGMPKIIDRRFAIDGGAVDNIPLYPILKTQDEFLKTKENLDLIIVMHFYPRYNYRKEFKTDIPILDIDVSLNNDFKKRHFDFSRDYIKEMISTAYEYGTKISKKLFGGSCTRQSFLKRINDIFVSEYDERQWHDSADGLLTVFNTLGKALRNNSDCNKRLF